MHIKETVLLLAGALAAVFALSLVLIRRWENWEPRYDERQQTAQGRAGKSAFGVVMVYLAVLLLLPMFNQELTVQVYNTALWAGVLLGAAVYATIAIWTDAYAGRWFRWQIAVPCLFVLAGLHLYDFVDGVIIMSGILVDVDFRVKLAVGVLDLYLAVLVFVRAKLNERE